MAKKALFIINTIGNGGAERVCVNMANELLKKNFEVDFITTKTQVNNNLYELNDKINIYSLNCKRKNKLLKVIEVLLKINKLNSFIKNKEKDGNYEIITSHLPVANIITRFSVVSKRSLYVFHTKIKTYDNFNHNMFIKLFNIFFKKRKIVCVSNGVREEAINDYKMDKKYIRTIYNPIDLTTIQKKASEKLEEKFLSKKYILQVGRFNEAKRQDRAVDIFYKGKFYEEYNLVFCGVGDLEEPIRRKVKKMNLEKSVYFVGWQKNIYKWIKNADILLCTSDYEAFPMNLIEALACNTKIVTSNCNYGPKEIMLGEFSEFLVESDNISEYIEKIKKIQKFYPKIKNNILEKCDVKKIIYDYIYFYKEKL